MCRATCFRHYLFVYNVLLRVNIEHRECRIIYTTGRIVLIIRRDRNKPRFFIPFDIHASVCALVSVSSKYIGAMATRIRQATAVYKSVSK